MECCLVLVVLSPQLEDDVALRTRPFCVLVLDSKVDRILVTKHVSLCVFVPLEAETGSESTLAHIAEMILLLGVSMLGTNMPHQISYRLQAY